MEAVMGFSSFGAGKKARTFDVMAMFEQAKKTAQERSQARLAAEEEAEKEKDNSSDSDGEMIGPPIPNKDPEPASKFRTGGFKPAGFKPIGESAKSSSEPTINTEDNADMKKDEDDEEIGPPLPPSMCLPAPGPSSTTTNKGDEDMEEEAEEDDDDDDNPIKKIPSSHEVVLEHGSKMVSALALDPSGARLVTGGNDYIVKFWDFAGMDATLQSFRQLQPCECHIIRSLEYSSTGDMILVVAGNSQAKVIDRDGFEVLECAKGDQYIADKARTKGHTAMLNSGCWNPKVKDEFMTCSNDGTLRIWDVKNKGTGHIGCAKIRGKQGRQTVPSTCCYSRDGKWVAAACQDGSIQVYDRNRKFITTAMLQRDAHQFGTDTSSLCFSYDGKTLASRGGDDTVKTWDIRNFKQPLKVAKDLLNLTPVTDCIFSPDDRLVITGVSKGKDETHGRLVFLDRETLQTVYTMEPSKSSVVRCIWHPRLNQVVVGCGDGSTKLYYDPDKSNRGAKLCVVKTKRKIKQVEMLAANTIITPHALPMFRQARPSSTRKQEEKARKDPLQSHRPDLPVQGSGVGGRLGAKGATLSQYVVQNLVKRVHDERDKDPRAAILRHAEEAAKNPFWVSPAYKTSQPAPIFKEDSDSEEEKDDGPLWKKQRI